MAHNVQVCFSPASFPLFRDDEAIVVVIDVLRATSAICTAFEYGVEKMIPVSTLEEAFDYKKMGYLVAAERDGSMGNSPYSYMDESIKGKTIVLTTTNGTKAINAAKNAHKVAIGSFLNLNVLAEWLSEQERNVILLCAGWKDKFNMEDSLFAGALAEQLLITKKFTSDCDSARASVHLWNFASEDLYPFLRNSSHRNRLGRLNLDKDIRYCLTPNQTFCIPVLNDGALIKLEKDLV
jgi:2-phosphosulfolactate phosphatase